MQRLAPSSTRQVRQAPASLFTQPAFHPQMTWGLGTNGLNHSSYVPGPGGPIPDNRLYVKTIGPGPIFGRVGALAALRTFGPTIGVFLGWPPRAPFNNSWAPLATGYQMYVPGWFKPPPTPTSGF